MPDKLTDNEIKKALECCCGIEHDCDKCPYEENNECGELNGILKDALDLINRLQAENERLKNTIDDMLDREPLLVERSEKYAKAEAYKEFAERLKGIITKCPKSFISITARDIDNLLKEMVGEDK